jgi:hypothetical protein
MAAMIPLQIEDAGYTGAVAFEGKPPGRRAQARWKIGRCGRGLREHVPARQRGAGLGRAGLAKEQPHDPALARPEGEAAAGGKAELSRISADFGEGGGEPATAQSLLEDPERLAGAADADDDEPGRVEAEPGKARAIGKASFARGGSLQNPENRPFVGDQGQEGGGKAGSRADVGEGASDLMQGIAAQPSAESLVEGGDSEGQMIAPPWPERSGLLGQPPGIANLSADVEAREMALDLGDPAA